MLLIVAGIATAFNIGVIIYKWRNLYRLNAVLDGLIALLLVSVFSNTGQGGIIIAMIASSIISVYIIPKRSW
jgi:hypothetical protein